MTGMGSGNPPGSRPKPKGVHHANIRDEKASFKRMKASFRRAEIPLILDADKRTIMGSAVLAEITPKSCYIFVREKIAKYSTLTMKITEPLAMDVRGRIRYCEPADRNMVAKKAVTGSVSIYRALVEFMVSSETEGEALHDLYQQVRDENYVATKWHRYVTEKAQQDAKIKESQAKLAERVKEAQDTPDLASPDMLVEEGSKAEGSDAKGKGDADDEGGEQQAA